MSRKTRKFFQTLGLITMSAPAFAGTGKVTKVELTPAKERAIFILSYEGDAAKFRMIQSDEHANVVVEAENVELPARLSRAIDLSKSNGPVLQVTPYSAGDGKRALSKFVLQLRGGADVISSELPGKFMLELKKKAELPANAKKAAANARGPVRPTWSETDALSTHAAASEKSEEIARRLVEVLNSAPEEKKYFGSPVTIEGSKMEVHQVFELIGSTAGLNIVTDADVKGEANYSLRDVPWDQVLDIVVQQNQLKAKVSGNVVRLITAKKFNEEQEEKLKEISIADELEPVVMAVIPLSFAVADKMKETIETLLVSRTANATVTGAASAGGAGGAGGGAGAAGSAGSRAAAEAAERRMQQDFVRGRIEVDARSNSLVITNTRETIERIRRLVKELDVALPQVLIDTKVVIAQEGFSRKVGFKWGALATSGGSGRSGVGLGFGGEATSDTSAGGTIGDSTSGGSSSSGSSGGSSTSGSSGGSSGTESQFAVSAPAGEFLGGFRIGAGQHGNLNAQLALAEVNNLSKTIASPRVIVNNNVEATVTDGQTINTLTNAGANAAGSLATINAALNLKVKPQVTSSGAVLLAVDVKKSTPVTGGTGLSTNDKAIKTNVLVDSGSTLVLGGVYQFTSTRREDGIPLLKDLPFIGQLFRFNADSDTKDELMVFLTPQILDTSTSALGTAASDTSTGNM